MDSVHPLMPAPQPTILRWRLAREPVLLTGLAAVYVVAAKLGLRLAFVHASATPVWPNTGLALAALLILGARVWPAVLVGAFVANLTTAGSVATSLGIAAGNTLEALVGAYLVSRFASGRRAFDRANDVFKFTLLAAIVSTAISASVGVTSLALGGFARGAEYGPIWLTWWLGDAVGDLVVAPVVLLWYARPLVRWPRGRALEAAALLAGVGLAGLIVFGGFFPARGKDYPLEFMCIPFFLWAAARFRAREAATAVLVLSAIAIRGTLLGYGPFVREAPNESLLLLQAFMGVAAVMTLILAAAVSERKRVEAQLRRLTVSDALTGLGNYRQLATVLEAEIQRSQRTERRFAVVFLDVDGLKQINDRHGHVVGSRALCRVAEVLHGACRAVDTAARFGGDEFALVLPEADGAAAARVVERIVERLAKDIERPRVATSLGVAVYPQDGETVEALLGAADRVLYKMKARQHAPAL
jgi:diguanylate cyclase (GGDEF)-like protein